MQSRRPKPTKVGDKKSNPRSTSAPKVKKESDGKDSFSYLRKTNEKVESNKFSGKDEKSPFKKSFGKKSQDVMGKASKFSSDKGGKKFAAPSGIDKFRKPKDTEGGFSKASATKGFKKPATGRNYEEFKESRSQSESKSFADPSKSAPKLRATGKGKKSPEIVDDSNGIRLNRFISNSGVCARREADKLIEAGEIYVNGKVTSDFSCRVMPDDTVRYGSKVLKREKPVYLLLNKPKDYLTTTDDPEGRKSVMDLVKDASDARLYPVGRLDRNTTGLILLTNDGDLAEKLMHPSYKAKKIYQVDLDKPFTDEDLQKVRAGIMLEDGPIRADDIEIVSPDRKCVGIEIHSGRNRIVRRIFESLEYKIERLDRVMYAGLTKKDLPRGTWRFLTPLEINTIKHIQK